MALAEGWRMGKEWCCKIFGEIAPEAPETGRERGKIPTFCHDEYTHSFGHFRFTDFHKTCQDYVNQTCQDYVNQCPHESFHIAKFWKFSVSGSLCSKNWIFGSFAELWASVTLKLCSAEKHWPSKGISSVKQHQSDRLKTYPLHHSHWKLRVLPL